jgi:hypothetical protein
MSRFHLTALQLVETDKQVVNASRKNDASQLQLQSPIRFVRFNTLVSPYIKNGAAVCNSA